ncbi:nuclear transport factor 2 family protein [Salinimicrobium soli]|uniref:nuclear transport factor 2 family protein n=1 Tax=Salinimicrobium soli TaxID=1254399 RepID=UPI003AAA5C26
MKNKLTSLNWFLCVMLLLGTNVFAQDPSREDSKHYKVEMENDEVRVLRIKYAPGDTSVMHEHPKGVVVFLTDSKVGFTLPDKKEMAMQAKAGEVIWTDGGKHKPTNTSGESLEAIQIELKDGGDRYTTSSSEISQTKKLIEQYENQEWDNWKNHYADGAKIFHNNWDEAATPDQFIQSQKDLLKQVSAYEFVDDPIFFEQVVDDDGKKWVYVWGTWQGTLKGSGEQLRIPVHLALEYKDGKIIEEFGFYDLSTFMEKTKGM